jgi:hypothetical protein
VKISSATTPSVCDTSDSNFSVLEKSTLAVVAPNGGEYVEKGKTCSITWNSSVTGNLKIDLYKDNMPETTIVSSVSGAGPYSWNVPAAVPTGYTYSIRITSVSNPLVYDESDRYFTIVNPIVNTPYTQNFDSFKAGTNAGSVVSGSPVGFDTLIGSWEQGLDDDLNWTVWKGTTPSKVAAGAGGTGPNGDHTTANGNYLYVEASGANSPSKSAKMLSPMMNTSNIQNVQIGFWFHMFSSPATMGDLFVDVYADGVWKDSVVHLYGDHGDSWHNQLIQLGDVFPQSSTSVSKVQVRFTGITGTGYAGDICVDDFSITGTATPNISTNGAAALRPMLTHSGNFIKYYNVNGELNIVMLNGKKVAATMVKGRGALDISKLAEGVYCARINNEIIKFIR